MLLNFIEHVCFHSRQRLYNVTIQGERNGPLEKQLICPCFVYPTQLNDTKVQVLKPGKNKT